MTVGGMVYADDATANREKNETKASDTRTGIKDGTNAETGMQAGSQNQAGMSGGSAAQQIRQFAQNPETAGDRLFALGAAEGNLWEVEFSKLVQQKAQDQQVKDLAKMVEKDHAAANEKLRPVAQKLQVQFPSQLSEMKQAKLEVFRSLPADKLEKCYVGMLKCDHAKDIIAYSIQQNEVKDAGLKQYVSETLPKLKEHGQHVQQVANAKGIAGGDITSLASATGSGTNQPGMNQPGMNQPGSSSTDRPGQSGSSGGISGGTTSGGTSPGASAGGAGSSGAGSAQR